MQGGPHGAVSTCRRADPGTEQQPCSQAAQPAAALCCACTQRKDNGSSSHDPSVKSKMNLGSTAGLLSTPHARTDVEQAVDGSSDSLVKEGRISVDTGPGRINSLSRSLLVTRLTSLLYDPSLYVRDEAAFALWHAKQRFTVRPLCSCYVPARQCQKHVKPRQSLEVWMALNRWIRWQSGSYLQLR